MRNDTRAVATRDRGAGLDAAIAGPMGSDIVGIGEGIRMAELELPETSPRVV